jgi:predicted ATPase
MITSIKIAGYKSLKETHVSLQPLTVFLGENNVGKSNFFDALRLLSNAAKMPVAAAFSQGNHRGDAIEAFFSDMGDTTIRFEAELDLSAAAHPFNKTKSLKQVWFMYSLEIHFNEQDGLVKVMKETLSGKTENGKKSKSFIEHHKGRTIVNRDEGKGNNRKFDSPSNRSVLLMIDDAELYPSVCAVREELSSWKFFHFEPNALRESSQKINLMELEADGRGLSGFYDTLIRTDPKRFEAAMAGLRRAIPEADILDTVDTGDNRRLLQLRNKSGKAFTARDIP